MAINFPSSPVNGQTFSASGQNWIYNSSIPAWELDSPFVPVPSSKLAAGMAAKVFSMSMCVLPEYVSKVTFLIHTQLS